MRWCDWDSGSLYPDVLEILMLDRTTGGNILLIGDECKPLSRSDLSEICPRFLKTETVKGKRTKTKAEVFTPSHVIKYMNSAIEDEYKGKDWTEYVLANGLEITCGEGAFVVSRYDASTGEKISILERVGFLDRKIKYISDHIKSPSEWHDWVVTAFKKSYAYEWQGDNLILARVNAFLTFVEYTSWMWSEDPTKEQSIEIAEIISWNFWQMDGLTGCIPKTNTPCLIMSWDEQTPIEFRTIKSQHETEEV